MADTWKLYTLEDAFKPRPPAEYAVSNLIRLPSLGMFYGPPGCLKSMLLADMAVCISGGIDWLQPAAWQPGSKPRTVLPCPVLWLDLDNGKDTTEDRFKALATGHKVDPGAALFYYTMPSPWPRLIDDAQANELKDRIFLTQARVVIIDNLARVSAGVDENTRQMDDVMNNLRQISEATRTAIILIHHSSKDRGTGGRAGDRLRGHSSIEAALDLAISVEREEYSSKINLITTKSRHGEIPPFAAEWTYKKEADDTLIEGAFYGLAADDDKSDYALDRVILSSVDGTWTNKTNLRKLVKEELPDIGNHRIESRISFLAAAGKLAEKPGNITNEKLYRHPSSGVFQSSSG